MQAGSFSADLWHMGLCAAQLVHKALLKGFRLASPSEANQDSTRLAMRRLRLRPKPDARVGA
jgi:hypothetical protein